MVRVIFYFAYYYDLVSAYDKLWEYINHINE